VLLLDADTARESADATAPVVTPPPEPVEELDRRSGPGSRRVEGIGVFVVAFAAYSALAGWLVLVQGEIGGDVVARVTSAYGAVAGRDAHLGAIGFVRSPLPTMLLLPLLPFRLLWPALVTHGFAACIVSAAATAGWLAVVRSLLSELGTGRRARLLLVALVAVNPTVAWVAASGSSEPVLVLCLLLAARGLLRWLRDGSTGHLVATGLALAAAYLAGPIALAAAVATAATVGCVTFRGSRSASPGERRRLAALDAGVVVFPVVVSALAWAVAGWALVDDPFAQRSSAVVGTSTQDGVGTFLGQLVGIAPALPLVAALVVGVALVSRRLVPFGPWIVLGAVVVTRGVLGTRGAIAMPLSAMTMIVPLVALGLGAVLGVRSASGSRWRRNVAALAVIGLGLGVGIPTTAAALVDRRLDPGDSALVRVAWGDATRREVVEGGGLAAGRAVVRELEPIALGRGELLVDSSVAGFFVLSYPEPDDLVLRSDRDFEAALSSPWIFGVRYLLVTDEANDEIAAHYPDLGRGEPVATLIRTFGRADSNPWRLYAVQPLLRPDGQPATSQRNAAAGSGR
jgi:hypothetical protein